MKTLIEAIEVAILSCENNRPSQENALVKTKLQEALMWAQKDAGN